MRCFLGLGSNIEPRKNLALGLGELDKTFGLELISPVYRCPAWGFDGPDFLNMVVAIESALAPPELVELLRTIEYRLGRPARARKFSNRQLDIDLLLCGQLQSSQPVLPRNDVLTRDFVLCPLSDIAPSLCHPITGHRLDWHWQQHCQDHECQLQRQADIRPVYDSLSA